MSEQVDLFGGGGTQARVKHPKRGYAGIPGNGPAGETCRSCKHRCHAGRYSKCGLMMLAWTHSYGTDILQRSPACDYWKPQQ